MVEADAVKAIMNRAADRWTAETALALATTLVLDNDALLAVDTFANVQVQHLRGRQDTLGAHPRMLRRGVLRVIIRGPANKGRKGTSVLADAVRRIYENQELGGSPGVEGVSIYEGNTREIGTNGRWYITSVEFDFKYYEQK